MTEKKPTPVRLFNKSKRTFIGTHPDVIVDGVQKEYKFPPEKAMAFHPDEAEKLRKLYPLEILSLEDVQSQFADADAEAPAAPVKGVKTISVAQAEKDKKEAVAAALDAYRAQLAADELDKDNTDADDADPEKEEDGESEQESSESDDDEFARNNTIAKAAGGKKAKK